MPGRKFHHGAVIDGTVHVHIGGLPGSLIVDKHGSRGSCSAKDVGASAMLEENGGVYSLALSLSLSLSDS